MADKKITMPDIRNRKGKSGKIVMLTAYDYPLARLADQAGVDIILVSDALGMVGLGYETTLPVTMDEMVHHTKAVVRGARNALVVATLPFMAAEISASQALQNAGRLIKEGGANGVEVEGGLEILDTVRTILDAGIPVIPHIGLTRKDFVKLGGFATQAKTASDAARLLELAKDLQKLGVPAVLLECIPDKVAQIITRSLDIPTIGIGAGPHCDGQALVTQDMLGLFPHFVPKFVKRYLNLAEEIQAAVADFRKDVESGNFPAAKHCFSIADQEFQELKNLIQKGD